MNDVLTAIAENVILGRTDKSSPFSEAKMGEPGVKELTEEAIETGIGVEDILDKGLLAGMDVVGTKFKNDEFFIPEVMIAADAFKAGMDLVKPLIATSELEPTTTVVIGTVKGDLHDIGKNIVGMMLQGANFEVIDLGVDVPVEKFIETIQQENPNILGLSSLLTTTMQQLKNVIDAVEEAGLRDQVKVMVGGAPLTQDYADGIGADGYAPDAVYAVEKVKELLGAN
jgi:5-methyltetrahydrofolate--homocysteine methyltransferase